MNKNIILTLAALVTGSPALSGMGPLAELGDNATLHFTMGAGARYSDNLYLSRQNKESDLILVLSPGLELAYGEQEIMSGTIRFREDFYIYADNSNQNISRTNLEVDHSDKGPVLEWSFRGSYQQLSQNSRDIRGDGFFVNRDIIRANLMGEYSFSPKFSVETGLRYYSVDYGLPFFADRVEWSVPVNVYYDWTPRVDLSVGYRYRDVDVKPFFGTGNDSKDHFLTVGARGEFTPKLSGFYRVGIARREFSLTRNRTTLAVDSSLSYQASPKLNHTLTLSRDFDSSGEDGNSFDRTYGRVRSTYLISTVWSFTGTGTVERASYLGGRKDTFYNLDFFLTYSPKTYLTFSGGYTYWHNDSNRAIRDFRNNVLSIFAGFRY